jgi:hypothetical protein
MDNEKKAILSALEESCGVISTACKSIGMPRSTFYNWVNADPEFKAAVEELQEYTLDVVESELHKQIKKGDTTAIIFYLKTKGKKRGYIEKQEVDLRTPEGITVNYVRQQGNEPLADGNS